MSEFTIDFSGVQKRFPSKKGPDAVVLNNIDLKVRKGEFVSLVGSSGCGKSTLLYSLLGAEFPSEGCVSIGGHQVTEVNRHCGIVYQKYSLIPHYTVLENIAAGPEGERVSLLDWMLKLPHYRRVKREMLEKAREFLEHIGLDPADGDKYPRELSGGMQQRVAIAQAVINQPTVLVMDEPNGALDDTTRREMQAFIREKWAEYNMTIVFVTHDLEEAVYLGTRIIGLSKKWRHQGVHAPKGAVIATDRKIQSVEPRTEDFKYTPEFAQLVKEIREDVLMSSDNPADYLDISAMRIDHPDGVRPTPWELRVS